MMWDVHQILCIRRRAGKEQTTQARSALQEVGFGRALKDRESLKSLHGGREEALCRGGRSQDVMGPETGTQEGGRGERGKAAR